MELKYNKLNRVMEFLYENPAAELTVREFAKRIKIPLTTTHIYLKELRNRNLIDNNHKPIKSLLFKIMKINFHVQKIVESGLLEYLINELNPSCIIVFGSIRKGDSYAESDIDIFIETPLQKKLALIKYEKVLKHKIELLIEKDIYVLQPQLLNNVLNGIKLYGEFKVK